MSDVRDEYSFVHGEYAFKRVLTPKERVIVMEYIGRYYLGWELWRPWAFVAVVVLSFALAIAAVVAGAP
jgi:hypothetical protein